jgi:hypothetical protein
MTHNSRHSENARRVVVCVDRPWNVRLAPLTDSERKELKSLFAKCRRLRPEFRSRARPSPDGPTAEPLDLDMSRLSSDECVRLDELLTGYRFEHRHDACGLPEIARWHKPLYERPGHPLVMGGAFTAMPPVPRVDPTVYEAATATAHMQPLAREEAHALVRRGWRSPALIGLFAGRSLDDEGGDRFIALLVKCGREATKNCRGRLGIAAHQGFDWDDWEMRHPEGFGGYQETGYIVRTLRKRAWRPDRSSARRTSYGHSERIVEPVTRRAYMLTDDEAQAEGRADPLNESDRHRPATQRPVLPCVIRCPHCGTWNAIPVPIVKAQVDSDY